MANKRWSGVNTYSVHEAQNAALGQGGSALISTDSITVPEGKTIIAITFLEDSVFENSSGLVAEDNTRWANSEEDAAKTSGGSGDIQTDGKTFSSGITIYGRWTTVHLSSGLAMIYVA